MTCVPIFPPLHTTPWPHVSLLLRGIVAQAQVPLLTPSGPPPPLESPSHQEEKDGEVGGAIDWGCMVETLHILLLSLLVSPSPAPNCYSVQQGQTRQGKFTGPVASMKGRQTPALYSGFPSSHMARLQSFST